jgi:phosphatidylserine/phosphatidylglycerophosphate/cardiolipin synthase-like enzyme
MNTECSICNNPIFSDAVLKYFSERHEKPICWDCQEKLRKSEPISCNNCQLYIGIGKLELLRTIGNAKKSVDIVSPYLSNEYVQRLIKLATEEKVSVRLFSNYWKEDLNLNNFKGIIKQERKIDVAAEKEVKELKKQLSNLRDRVSHFKKIKSFLSFINFSILIIILACTVFKNFNNWLVTSSLISVITISVILAVIKSKIEHKEYAISKHKETIRSTKIYSYEYTTSLPLFDFYLYKTYSDVKEKNTNEKDEKETKFVNDLHSKIYIIDKKIGYLGSSNFTKRGLEFNHEVLIKITDENAITLILRSIDKLKRKHDKEYQQEKIGELGKDMYPEPINDEY